MLTRIIKRTAQRAYQAGRDAAIMELLTSEQVGERLGIDGSRVRQIARQHDIGWPTERGWRLFRPEDVERIQAVRRPVGRRPRAERSERE